MNRFLLTLLAVFLLTFAAPAQNRITRKKPAPKFIATQNLNASSNSAVVIDERLAVLRGAPGFFARPLQRMRRGRLVTIVETKDADGSTFYRVTAARKVSGWIQKDAIAGKSRRGDDERLARLIQASDGFEQVERAQIFLENYPASPLRPQILLLFGDLMEELSLKMSNEATRRLNRAEMAATDAPLHSFYLNYPSLDRYRRLGVIFLFNPQTKRFHYNGKAWREINEKYPGTPAAVEAARRLDAIKTKMRTGN